MPAVIAGALAAYGTTAYAVIYVIATVVINVGLSKIAQSLSGKPRASRGGTTGRDVTARGTVEPRQMVYGQIKAGGFIAFLGLSGTKNKYLHVVVIYAAHQCEEIGDLWLDERKVLNAGRMQERARSRRPARMASSETAFPTCTPSSIWARLRRQQTRRYSRRAVSIRSGRRIIAARVSLTFTSGLNITKTCGRTARLRTSSRS
jgi:hypothetical protein